MTRPTLSPTGVRVPSGDPVYGVIGESSASPVPSDHALVAWNYDPILVSGAQGLVSGTPSLARLYLRERATISKLWCYLAATGTSLVSNQNFMGLYDSAGARVGVTADQTSAWGSTGLKSPDLTAPVELAAGAYWVALLSNASSTPTFGRCAIPSTGLPNAGLAAATARFGAGPASQTTMPTSITPANLTLSSSGVFWVAAS